MKLLLLVVFTVLTSAAYSGQVRADNVPSGTIEIDETQFGLIIGGSEGKGTLNYQGAEYFFKTSRIKVGGVGVAKISAAGEV